MVAAYDDENIKVVKTLMSFLVRDLGTNDNSLF